MKQSAEGREERSDDTRGARAQPRLFRSGSAMFGANRVSQACRRTEAGVRAGAAHCTEAQLSQLDSAYQEARAELSVRMLEQRGTTSAPR